MSSTKEILKRLKALREDLGLRQDQLAAKLGVDRSTYARKEQGAIPITTDEWLRIAVALDEDVVEFFRHDGDGGGSKPSDDGKALLRLYTSLNMEERHSLAATLRLILKGIKRKKVRDALSRLK